MTDMTDMTVEQAKQVITCTPDDRCDYDHTCKSHRAFADVVDRLRARIKELEAQSGYQPWADSIGEKS